MSNQQHVRIGYRDADGHFHILATLSNQGGEFNRIVFEEYVKVTAEKISMLLGRQRIIEIIPCMQNPNPRNFAQLMALLDGHTKDDSVILPFPNSAAYFMRSGSAIARDSDHKDILYAE